MPKMIRRSLMPASFPPENPGAGRVRGFRSIFFRCVLDPRLSPTPSRQPLFETSENGCANFMGAWDVLVPAASKSPVPIKFIGFCRNLRGIFLTRCLGGSCGGFLGPFPWKKQEDKIHPKTHSKIQIRIWEFRGQNP